MEEIGQVVAILNNEFILVNADHTLVPGQLLEVFQVVGTTELQETLGISSVKFPKGRVIVTSLQEAGLYLASTTTRKTVMRTRYNSPLAKLLSTPLLGEGEESAASVRESLHSQVDQAQSLKVTYERSIQVGDRVAEVEADA